MVGCGDISNTTNKCVNNFYAFSNSSLIRRRISDLVSENGPMQTPCSLPPPCTCTRSHHCVRMTTGVANEVNPTQVEGTNERTNSRQNLDGCPGQWSNNQDQFRRLDLNSMCELLRQTW